MLQKEIRWITWFWVAVVGIVLSLVLGNASRILGMGSLAACGVLLVASAAVLIRKRQSPFLKCGFREGCLSVILAIAIALPSLLLGTVACDLLIWSLPFSLTPEYRGAEYYEDEAYTRFRYGNMAEKYLPDYGELEGVEALDFYYTDCSMSESIFFTNCPTVFMLRVKYTEEQYAAEKESIMRRGQDFDTGVWMLARKEKFLQDCLYSMAKCFDEQNMVIYFVTLEEGSDYQSFRQFARAGFTTYGFYEVQDIWSEVESPK